MARVTSIEVKQVYPTDADISIFIDTATLLVDEELVSKELSVSRLKQIELYLAAHFASVSLDFGGIVKRKAGDGEEMYQGTNSSKGLTSTPFGQQATALDTTGTLGAISTSTVKAQFRII